MCHCWLNVKGFVSLMGLSGVELVDRESEFGEHVERLRRAIPKDRRPGKGELAVRLGISRSRWHRIMTGQGQLTFAEAKSLARELRVPVSALTVDGSGQWEPDTSINEDSSATYAGQQLEEFVSNIDRVVRMLSTGEGAKMGPKSKLAIMNGIEEAARLAGQSLPREFYDIRRRINEGTL